MTAALRLHPSSFRDPAGQVAYAGDRLIRLIDDSYREHFDAFLASGLYDSLRQQNMIVGFEDITSSANLSAYKVLAPERIDFISYSYEWCFSQLRDAALLTLSIQKQALARGMTLKDASAFNIQFRSGRPVHIDTLSFEVHKEGTPWIAYRQFCQHFLMPLALMAFRDPSAARLLASFPDGIPLAEGTNLLGLKWLRRPSLFIHFVLQARLASRPSIATPRPMSRVSLERFITHLELLVASLPVPKGSMHWHDYDATAPYTPTELEAKREAVRRFSGKINPQTVWALGENRGEFAAIAGTNARYTLAIEYEHGLVESMYKNKALLPLWIDMLAPSSMGGWGHSERQSLAARGPADLLLCLALTHHLAIPGHVPFARQAEYFAKLGRHLLIEYISEEDPKVAAMLAAQPTLRSRYTWAQFEEAFGVYFEILDEQVIIPGRRKMLLMRSRA